MDRKPDFKKRLKDADSIIDFLSPCPHYSLEEWAEIYRIILEWLADPAVSVEDKHAVQLSGYLEMISMIVE